MSRRFKITIAISGILIVALALLSFTYAYITTNITGNTNTRSVTVSTRDMTVVYTNYDVTSDSSEIAPGTNTYMKFTVKNTGNKDSSYKIYLMDVYNDFSRKSDITYILYRKAGNNTMDVEDVSNCSSNGCTQLVSGTFPAADALIRSGESLTSGSYYTYILKITYNTSTSDQTGDVGHKFSGRIQIFGSDSTIDTVSPFNEGTLAEKIYRNAKSVTSSTATGTMYSAVPKTSPANAINGSTEKTLSIAQDDYGASYYFRGNVVDNYVDYAKMCWRIVRIEGDRSIKLILEDQDNTCASSNGNWAIPTTTGGVTYTGNYGITYYTSNTLTASNGTTNSSGRYLLDYPNGTYNINSSMPTAFKNFQTEKLANYTKYLESEKWCLNDKAYASNNDNTTPLSTQEIFDKSVVASSYYYDSYVRLNGKTIYEPTLRCNGSYSNKFNNGESMYVGALTADEIAYAGGKGYTSNSNYYLINEEYKKGSSGANKAAYFWSLSPGYYTTNSFAYVYSLSSSGSISLITSHGYYAFRPAVTLKADTKLLYGDGTKTSPYVITNN